MCLQAGCTKDFECNSLLELGGYNQTLVTITIYTVIVIIKITG